MPDITISLPLLGWIKKIWTKIQFAIQYPYSALRHLQYLKWWDLSWDLRSPLGIYRQENEPVYIQCLQIFCENKSKKRIEQISGYVISNTTGIKVPLTIEGMTPEETNGIPGNCKFFIQALFRDAQSEREGIVEENFIKVWSDLTFIFIADSKKYKFHFGKNEIKDIIKKFKNESIFQIQPKIIIKAK